MNHLYITRREGWDDYEDENEITADEWRAFVEADNALKLSPSDGDEEVGLLCAEWSEHPNRKSVVFCWEGGNIGLNFPDEATIPKVQAIAEALRAKLQDTNYEDYTS